MTYGLAVRVRAPLDEVVDQVRDALAEQGFDVLTEIDIRATLRVELGEGIEPHVLLGACDPRLARRALGLDRRIGLLLLCTVVVRADGAETVVEALDPQVMVSVPQEPKLQPVADEAGRKLRAALGTLVAAAVP